MVDARGGELDREREAVHLTADLGDERDRLGGQLESWPRRPCPRGEQLHGRGSGTVGGLRIRHREGGDGDPSLAHDAEGLAARGQHPHAQAVSQQRRCNPRGLLGHVLTRVQNDDRVGVTQTRDRARERVPTASVEGLGNDARHVSRASSTRQLNQSAAVAQSTLV